MTKKEFDTVIDEHTARYNSIGRVRCPILNSYVHFTAEGRLHLLYKANRKKRTVSEQQYKLRLFPLVIPVIKHSQNIQAWRFASDTGTKGVQHYALVGTASRKHPIDVRVIVKRTGDGQFNFHSVMEHTKKPRRKRRG